MMLNIGNTFSRSGCVLVHFCPGEHRHLFKRRTPSIGGILDRRFASITIWGVRNTWCTSDSNALLFSLSVKTIWIGIQDIFVLSSLDILFHPDKEIRWLLNLNKSYKWLVEYICKITKGFAVLPLKKFSFGFEAFAWITSTFQPKFKFFVL